MPEPACANNASKAKGGCARSKPGATAGGCTFDGAQITLFPIADVAHIVHGPIACAGDSWDNRGTRTTGAPLFRLGMKWKKFFYRQLCERSGMLICKSPRCADCVDYRICFGPES